MAFELPEAVTVARQMQAEFQGKKIQAICLGPACASLIRQGFVNLSQVDLTGTQIEFVTAQGKWIYVKLTSGLYLLFALETGGKLLYHRNAASAPDTFHVKLDFADGTCLTEHITGWGWAKVCQEEELAHQKYPGPDGLSPLDDAEFTFENFSAVLDAGGKRNVKSVLMEQRKIAGIGNAYAQEILFRAKLHPSRKTSELSGRERRALYQAIRKILSEAVRRGGSHSEYDLYNHAGGYHRILGEHALGQPCPRCGTPIEKLKAQGTTSYLCPECQKKASTGAPEA